MNQYYAITRFYLGVIIFGLISTPINATLIGDTIYFNYALDTGSGFVYNSFLPTDTVIIGPIVAGDSDITRVLVDGPDSPTLDVEASGFSMEFYNVPMSLTEFVFNGWVISDFDYAPGYVISNVTVHNNLMDLNGGPAFNLWTNEPLFFDENRISFTDDTILLDFGGLAFNMSGSLDFEIAFSPVPIPPAFWLFFSGMLALIGIGKK